MKVLLLQYVQILNEKNRRSGIKVLLVSWHNQGTGIAETQKEL